MRDATVERLSKLISEPPAPDNKTRSNGHHEPRKPVITLSWGIEEGWFSLVLLATVVYSTIWSIQAVGWVNHLNILTLTTAIGLVIGVVTAKQRRFPAWAVHLCAIVFAILLAFWQTAGAFYAGSTSTFLYTIQHWFASVLAGSSGEDDSIFLFFITALGFVLAYASAWLLYRVRNPWLLIVANAVVLLINLSNVDSGFIIFLAVFLIASLLLLLRFNLHESIRRWRRQGLRYADDIGWDVMQAGTLISIGILIFSWLLPWGYINPAAAQIWTLNANPIVQLENTWNRAIAISGGANPANHGNFRDTLVLSGNPNLNHDVVMTVKSDDVTQYLESLSYDTYQGVAGWTNQPVTNNTIKANQYFINGPALSHTVKQNITIVSPPGEQKTYLLGASTIDSANVGTDVLTNSQSGDVVAWLKQTGNLTAGMQYSVVSLVSSADEQTLRTVPMPSAAPSYPPDYPGTISPTVYDPNIVQANLQLPKNLDPNVAALAKHITANAHTMYDKAAALEDYLRTHYTYSVDIQLPPGEEGVSWFLFRSGNKGYCNYFASAMAVMARTLGIPARVAVGYTNGTYDAKNHLQVIRGTDAHAWTQIYFAGYGWINFEPSASFSQFARPLPNQFVSSTLGGSVGGSSIAALSGLQGRRNGKQDAASNGGTSDTGTTTSSDTLGQQVGVTLGGLVLLVLFGSILFGLWWSRLFRRYNLVTQMYGRICLLARWAGVELRTSQTPYEYIHGLSNMTPEYAPVLERFGDIYVRERWADPMSAEHPSSSGEVRELPDIWKQLQPRLFVYVLRHPYFLRWLPERISRMFVAIIKKRRAHKLLEEDEL